MIYRLFPNPELELATAPASRERLVERGFERAYENAQEIGSDTVIQHIQAIRLGGRGGAAFPTARKWLSVKNEAESIKYVVMNADESEPGTFKDRELLLRDPLGPLTGLLIAASAVGAQQAYVYVRGEYRDVEIRIQEAITVLAEAGWIGPGKVSIDVRRGAGAYIAGEETALFNSIEGYRPEPRVKPPYPTAQGLFHKPTLIQNVETLANIALLFAHDVDWFRAVGTDATPGTKLVALSGHVANPGVYEVPFGIELGALIGDGQYGGGTGTGRPLKAVLMGGAAGTFITPQEAFEARLDYPDLAKFGAGVGSGAIMLFDSTADLGRILTGLARFFADESCGQCVPCRIGTKRILELLETQRLWDRRADLKDLATAMTDASICGLGQTAANALVSAMNRPSLWNEPAAL
ncbi:MAG: electron transport complex protein RnfC [Firmicutes bacterium]|nr:electron transport complex protein RnfC [Bacillota bacterium]